MVSATKNIVSVIFTLSILWKSSESFSLENTNITLGRIRRQNYQPYNRNGKSCRAPEQPQNGRWVYLSNGLTGTPNVPLDFETVLVFSCNENYQLSATNESKYFVICIESGKWSGSTMPTCQQHLDCINNFDERCGPKKPVITTPTPPEDRKTCRTPEQPQNGQWVYVHNPSQKGSPNVPVESSAIITFSCSNNYKLSTTNAPKTFVACDETGEWSLTKMPTCQMLCPPYYSNPIMTVKCSDDGSTVPCDKAGDGTVLTYKCSPYYEIPVDKPEKSICFRGTWDHAPQCIPVCGKKSDTVTPLIVDGKEVDRGTYPWVVALYRSKNANEFKNICVGSLISTRIVLTAAHCVTNKEGGGKYPPGLYRIAAGKYYSKYKDPRDDDTAQYSEIEQIEVSREYRGADQNFRGDIALLKLKTELKLTKIVQPVCFQNLPLLEPNTNGAVTGWGYTKAGSDPSDGLKELDLPYHDDDTCEQEMDSDFKRQYFTTDKFCVRFAFRNTTVCKGDSGGGLVFRNAKYRERFFVHGIFSLVPSITRGTDVQCNIQSAALFTKVDPYLTWIQKTVYQWS